MAELFTLLQLLAPSLVAALFDRSRGRAMTRAALLAGVAVAAPALTDLLRAPFGDAAFPDGTPDRTVLLPIAWAAQAASVGLCLALPILVRFARDVRLRAELARMAQERAGLAAEWGEGD